MESLRLDEKVQEVASLVDILHPCPRRISTSWTASANGSVHQDLVFSKGVSSASHRMRDLSVKVEGVTRAFSAVGNLEQPSLSAASIRESRRAAMQAKSSPAEHSLAIAKESAAWSRERRAFDEDVEREKLKIVEDFKRGLREGVKLGI